MRVGIDIGHGGKDPGSIGQGGLKEKDVTLPVGLLVIEKLQFNGFQVVSTRDTDTNPSLFTRSNLLNAAQVDLVISIHVNSSENQSANYVASFITGRGGQAEKAAKVIQEELRVATGWPGPSSKDGVMVSNLHMVRETKAAAVIVEMGFISNLSQENQLIDPAFHKILAKAIVKGICRHFVLEYREPVTGEKTVKVIAGDKEYSGLLIDGKTYVHVRVIEQLGTPVYWEQDTETVFIGEKPQQKLPRHEKFGTYDVITTRPDQLKIALIKGHLSQDGINGGYLDSNLNPLGITIIDGKKIADRVAYRPPRTVFTINGNMADILTKIESASKLNVKYALGAGPDLLPIVGQDEGFQDDIIKSNRERSAVGITANGLIKIVTTAPMTLVQLSLLMKSIGCIKAMNLDGGGSSHLRWQGKTVRGGGRAISTAIIFS